MGLFTLLGISSAIKCGWELVAMIGNKVWQQVSLTTFIFEIIFIGIILFISLLAIKQTIMSVKEANVFQRKKKIIK